MNPELDSAIDELAGRIADEMVDGLRLNTGQEKMSGYRDLSDEELMVINSTKQMGTALGYLLDRLGEYVDGDGPISPDGRWLAIAKTHFQQGFMALTRSITKPEGF